MEAATAQIPQGLESKVSTQRPYVICPRCSARMKAKRKTDYDFDFKCKCGEWRTISWAHINPPPEFEEQPQQDLFGGPGMNDQEKINKVKEIVTEWALDDNSNALTTTDTLIEIMETLEFDPYQGRTSE